MAKSLLGSITEQSDGVTAIATLVPFTVLKAELSISEQRDILTSDASLGNTIAPTVSGFTLVNAQTYRTSDFWEYVDWYADGFDETDAPVVTYATTGERNRQETLSPTNLFVKISNNGAGYWIWTAYLNGIWTTVAQQSGTIQLSSDFTTNSDVYGWNNSTSDYNFNGDLVRSRDGSFELRVLADALLDNDLMSNTEKNELWFSMINFIHAHHDQVDWVFKTSFMTLVGFNEEMDAAPVIKADNTDNILSYVEEVKPYHVTFRDFSRSYAPDVEVGLTNPTDFDKPGYYDEDTKTYRTLDEHNPIDLTIMEAGVWDNWLQHPELTRRVNIRMKFDRIWYETGQTTPGAAERIMSFYQPDNNMVPKDLTKLLGLDFKGKTLDGMTFTTVDPNAPVIQGGSVSTSLDINGDYDGQMGYGLRDPRVAAETPEEMARLGSHDIFLLRAHDKWGGGAPKTLIKTYDVSQSRDTHIDLPIGMIARDILVFSDGMRQIKDINYTVDQLANVVHASLLQSDGTRINNITIHAFGYAAHTTVIDQLYVVAKTTSVVIPVSKSVTAYETANGPNSFYVEVTINGKYVSSTLGGSSGSRTVSFTGIIGGNCVLTFYKGNDRATTSLKETIMPTRTNSTIASFQASYDLKTILGNDFPHEFPYSSTIIVEKNGLRLSPPRTNYAIRVNEKIILEDDIVDTSLLKIVDDTGDTENVTVVADTDYASSDDIRAANIPARYVYWKNIIVFRDTDALTREYAIIDSGTGDFYIDTTKTLVVKSIANGDVIRTLHWRNGGIMKPHTWAFKARSKGIYTILTHGAKGSTWLTINGRRMVEDVDYSIMTTTAGAWDVETYDEFRWDDPTEVEITIKNMFVGHDNDNIVITTFEGPQNSPEKYWQHSTMTPDIVRFEPSVLPEDGEGKFRKLASAWETATHDMKREGGVLSQDIGMTDNTFTITPNALETPSLMFSPDAIMVPNAKSKVAGVIWIGSERIEYFKRKIQSNGTILLDQVRRGTKGTVKLNHSAGSEVRVEHQSRIPPLPNRDIVPVPPSSVLDIPVTVFPTIDPNTLVSATDIQ